jgi:putative transposase
VRQYEVVQISRYQPKGENEENLELMQRIDEQFLDTPWHGSRQMARYLRRQAA